MSDSDRHDIGIGLCCGEVRVHGLLTSLGLCYELREVEIGVRSYYKVSTIVKKSLPCALSHTANNTNYDLLIAAESLQVSQTSEHPLLGIVADRAGVNKHTISGLDVFCKFIAHSLHDRGDNLTISHIHLATIGLDEKETIFFVLHFKEKR